MPSKDSKIHYNSNSQSGNSLESVGFIPSHFPTLPGAWNVTLELHSCPTPLLTLALVTSPRLGLRQKLHEIQQKFEKTEEEEKETKEILKAL
jgi:hypothetical protein